LRIKIRFKKIIFWYFNSFNIIFLKIIFKKYYFNTFLNKNHFKNNYSTLPAISSKGAKGEDTVYPENFA
jgi:hypothetical protein